MIKLEQFCKLLQYFVRGFVQILSMLTLKILRGCVIKLSYLSNILLSEQLSAQFYSYSTFTNMRYFRAFKTIFFN